MKTIIVPTDFSASATNAVNYAADLALQINASLSLLHVYQVPIAIADAPLILVSVDELRDSAENKLAELKKGLGHISSGRLKIYTEAKLGDLVDELKEFCEKTNPFAVIMGTTGHSDFERALFGSNTLSAIKHLRCPVLAVPIGKEFGAGIKKIGLACDFREVVASTPFSVIRNFVTEIKAELHVLNVDFDNRQHDIDMPEQSALLHTELGALNPQYHFIKHKDIEDGINEFSETNNMDLVIAIPKKHRLLDGLFKKSSTRQLVSQSRVPVMCIHE